MHTFCSQDHSVHCSDGSEDERRRFLINLLHLLQSSILMRGLLFVVLLLCVAGQSSDERARAMLARMSEAEKLSWVAGSDSPSSGPSHYVGVLPSIPRLGLPAVTMEDGPQGVADGTRDTVAWPSAATVGQTWSEPLYRQCALPLLSLFFLLSLSHGFLL